MKRIVFSIMLFFALVSSAFSSLQPTTDNCNDINDLAKYGILGESGFTYGNNSEINNNNIAGSGNTPTPMGSVTTVNLSFPPIEPATFPSFTASTNLTKPSTVSPGIYDTITLSKNGMTSTFSAGEYRIKKLELTKTNISLNLAPGKYFIEEFDMGDKNKLIIVPEGKVEIYIKTSLIGKNQLEFNSGGAVENLAIYLYENSEIDIENGDNGSEETLTFNGLIYSPYSNTTISFKNNNNIQGAILSNGTIDVGNNTEFNYSADIQNAIIGSFGCTPSQPHMLMAEYRLDECVWNGTNGEVKDSSTNANHGTAYGDNSDNKVAEVSKDVKKVGFAGYFRGEGYSADPNNTWYQARYYHQISDNDVFSPLSSAKMMSISTWFKTSNSGTILSKSGSQREYRLFVEGGALKFELFNLNNSQFNHIIKTGVNDGVWHHVVLNVNFSSDGSVATINSYIDNTHQNTSTHNITSYINTNSNFYIGAMNWGANITNFFDGYIDEVKIYKGVLNSTEVSKIYTNELAGKNYDGNIRPTISCDDKLKECYVDDFNRGTLGSVWTIIKNDNFTPSIVDDKMMLTRNTNNIASGVSLSGSFPSNDNLVEVEFEHNAYGGNGADGLTVVLSDANVTPVAGAYGGSLGYAQRSGRDGFAGGWLGFGIDEFGNFANDNEGRGSGCASHPPSGRVLDSVTIRGRQGSTLRNGYCFIANSGNLVNAGYEGIDNTSSSTPSYGHKYKFLIDTRGGNTKITVARHVDGNGYVALPNMDKVNATQVATAPNFFRFSITASTGGSRNYHSFDDLKIKALNCGTLGNPPEMASANFDAWDYFRPQDGRYISTKVVNKNFDLKIGSFSTDMAGLQDYNGTVCVKIVDANGSDISKWQKLLFSNENTKTETFKSSDAYSEARISLKWQANVESNCSALVEDNSTYASDKFAIRPDKFDVDVPTGNRVAEDEFSITFTANDVNGNPTNLYNATEGVSFRVDLNDSNATCESGTFSAEINNSWSFTNGTHTINTSYDDVGYVDINISEDESNCNSRFASIDCLDPVVGTWTQNGTMIESFNTTIKFIPWQFNVTAVLSNAGDGFTYLASEADVVEQNMTAMLDINISALGKDGNVTEKYSSKCFAKDIDLTLTYDSNATAPLTKMWYVESNTSKDGNTSNILEVTNADLVLNNLDKSIFEDGNASLHVRINFDRNFSTPVNPFGLRVSNVKVKDTDNVNGNDNTDIGVATFYYGRIRPLDVVTTTNKIVSQVEMEVYDGNESNYTQGFFQNSIGWYRNALHDDNETGEVLSAFDSAIGATSDGSQDTLTITPDRNSIENGTEDITISTTQNPSIENTIHLGIPRWLWYTNAPSADTYDISNGSTCKAHPCFEYVYEKTYENDRALTSGDFNGSDFGLSGFENSSSKKRGPKVFR